MRRPAARGARAGGSPCDRRASQRSPDRRSTGRTGRAAPAGSGRGSAVCRRRAGCPGGARWSAARTWRRPQARQRSGPTRRRRVHFEVVDPRRSASPSSLQQFGHPRERRRVAVEHVALPGRERAPLLPRAGCRQQPSQIRRRDRVEQGGHLRRPLRPPCPAWRPAPASRRAPRASRPPFLPDLGFQALDPLGQVDQLDALHGEVQDGLRRRDLRCRDAAVRLRLSVATASLVACWSPVTASSTTWRRASR